MTPGHLAVASRVGLVLVLWSGPALASQPENTAAACQDGADNDGDGWVDCSDQDCGLFVFCAQPATAPPLPPVEAEPVVVVEASGEQDCGNRQDDDADGAIDCADPDCSALPACTQPASGPATGQEASSKLDMGFSVYGSFAFPVGARYDWKDRILHTKGYSEWEHEAATGGTGVILDKRFGRYFSFGGELHLAFPKVDRIHPVKPVEWPATRCTDCNRDILISILLRFKVPIPIGKYVAPYPFVGAGLGLYQAREDGNRRVFLGPCFAAGAGAEFHPIRWLSPFVELRYLLVMGWNDETSTTENLGEKLTVHTILLNLGARFH